MSDNAQASTSKSEENASGNGGDQACPSYTVRNIATPRDLNAEINERMVPQFFGRLPDNAPDVVQSVVRYGAPTASAANAWGPPRRYATYAEMFFDSFDEIFHSLPAKFQNLPVELLPEDPEPYIFRRVIFFKQLRNGLFARVCLICEPNGEHCIRAVINPNRNIFNDIEDS